VKFCKTFIQGIDMAVYHDINDIVEWVKVNATITHLNEDLIVGNVKGYHFRVFAKERWVGVIEKDGSWGKARACYSLTEFLRVINHEKEKENP
jgi:hypothetical protein